jgi:hypothetical protein
MKLPKLFVAAALVGACTGNIHVPGGGPPNNDGGNSNPDGGSTPDGGGTTPDSGTFTFTPATTTSAVAKVKNLLTGLPPTAQEVQSVTTGGQAALKTLVQGWIQTPGGQGTLSMTNLTPYQSKMLEFFSTAFQQTQVQPTQFESNQNFFAGGGNSTNLMLANQEQMFALTAMEIGISEQQPFTHVITTQQFMMTPALMSFYAMVDTQFTDDTGRFTDTILKANPNFQYSLSAKSGPIPLEEALDAGSPYYMTFYVPQIAQDSDPNCAAMDPWVYNSKDTFRNRSTTESLYAFLQGAVDRASANTPDGGVPCTPPVPGNYFPLTSYALASDFTTWSMVTIRPPKTGEKTLQFYDYPTMRTQPSEIVLNTPRVSFFTTPAFLADWQTNSSNQARVTINQTMIVGLGHSFDGTNAIAPQSLAALDSEHAPQNSACFSCHQTLDPMRQYFRQTYSLSFNVQTDAGQADMPGQFAFAPVSVQGAGIADLANQIANHPLFAAAWVQRLCTYATSAACDETDPEFQRLVTVFINSNYNWQTLVGELFASPIVTYLAPTQTALGEGETFPLTRQAHLCALLSNRLNMTDVCGLLPTTVLNSNGRSIQTIVSVLPSDQFSRGVVAPVLANDPTLFYRAGLENLCLNVAQEVVDNPAFDAGYSSADAQAAIQNMASNLMALTPDRVAGPLQVLQEHFAACKADGGATNSEALKSTLALACMSPYVAGVGQ